MDTRLRTNWAGNVTFAAPGFMRRLDPGGKFRNAYTARYLDL